MTAETQPLKLSDLGRRSTKLESLGLKWIHNELWILDQRLLPHEQKWNRCDHPQMMVQMIQQLQVRGAPLIGVAASLSIAHYAQSGASKDMISKEISNLKQARPTAVNLHHAMVRMEQALQHLVSRFQNADWINELTDQAVAIFNEDAEICDRIASHGAHLINEDDHVLTHCNSGGLATAGIGTALGVIRRAHEQGKKIHVYVDETRPLMQGARLTAWELEQLQIPYTLICDNMAACLMKDRRVQSVFVGADRIARNGDFANKIGTYGLAVLAHHHKVPFYCVAPSTTLDTDCAGGAEIPIEIRGDSEVRGTWGPNHSRVFNPAFDVTPAEFVSGYISEAGLKFG